MGGGGGGRGGGRGGGCSSMGSSEELWGITSELIKNYSSRGEQNNCIRLELMVHIANAQPFSLIFGNQYLFSCICICSVHVIASGLCCVQIP